MKILRTLSIALVLGAATTAGAAPAAKPAPATGNDVSSADIQKFLAFFDHLVDTVIKDKDNCPMMAKDINVIIDDNKSMLDMAKQAKASGKTLPADAKEHMTKSAQRMMPGMQACGKDKAVQAAFQRLDMH